MSSCDYDHVTEDEHGISLYYCTLPAQHAGDHHCTSACGYPCPEPTPRKDTP